MSSMPPSSPESSANLSMASAIRALSMDAVQKANSGHPGAPMGMADMAVALWGRHLKHNPIDPTWFDRDRFVLSNGHASMLLYSVLHLTGYALTIDDLKAFRQLHSKTPGHPEVGITPGVETTTGPLGQGIANAVGMALAEKHLASEYNRPGFPLVDHFTYVFTGDGCLMEGVSHEACALAASFQLSKLIVLYDDNGISIDGQVGPWFSDDTVKRFQAYGWNVIPNVDGHDVWAVDKAIAMAKEWALGRADKFAPTLIQCKTVIGKGSPSRAGTSKAHGEPLGDSEIVATRAVLNWPHGPFEIPAEIYSQWDARVSGAQQQALWEGLFEQYQRAFPDLALSYERRMRSQMSGAFDDALDVALEQATTKAEKIATRKASQNALNAFGPALPELLGGSADLTGSNLTDFAGVKALRPGVESGIAKLDGRHINYGVREFGMAAVMNGIALHGGFIPYGGTFLTFSDYSRNAIRMAALMKLRVLHVFTHDSIGLGEDGPTHQSVEHAASLRLIPQLDVWRPGDPIETAIAWAVAIERQDGPSALLLSRQAVPFVTRSQGQTDAIFKGGYILRDAAEAKAVIIATGSELGVALAARELLANDGVQVRIVSIPCTSLFDRQDVTYKRNVLPDNLPRVAIEAGVTDGWWKYGCSAVVGVDRFGESAPAGQVFDLFGLNPRNLADTVLETLRRRALK
jgi:transketolase